MSKKKILITAGPTLVRIDSVRFLGNLATGRTGFYLAKEFYRAGFAVVLLINPAGLKESELRFAKKHFTVLQFCWLDEFIRLVCRQAEKPFSVIVHSAAVADYHPQKPVSGKIPSGKKSLVIKLKPVKKIIKILRRNKKALLVQFKLESRMSEKSLINKALLSMQENHSDIVIANLWESVEKGRNIRYIISKAKQPLKTQDRQFYRVFVRQIQGLIKS